jgi:opacity protein-like surface antigen
MDKRGSTKNGLSALAYLFIAIFIVVSPVSAGTNDHPLKFSIRLSGEAGFILVGDINTGLRTFNNNPAFKEIRKTNPAWASLEGNIETLNGLFANSEAEARIDFLRNFGLGIAVSGARINRRNESFLRLTKNYDPYFYIHEYSYEPEIMTSAPYKVSLYYYLSPGAKTSIYFNGGIGYYKGKISEQFDLRVHDDPLTFDDWTKRHWETEWKSTMGFHVGAGMEIQMGRKLRIFAELQGRYARISNFRAIQQYETGYPLYEETTGWLYYFTKENLFVYGLRHADLTVWEVPPEGSIELIRDIRKARLDFSGISLKVGVRLFLF